MQIKKRLQINAVVSVSLTLIVFIVFFFALFRIDRANNLAMISGDLIIYSLERLTLRNDFIRNNNQRAKEQWASKHAQIGQMLKTASSTFMDLSDKKEIDELLKNQESIGKIFSAIAANRENKSISAELSHEVEERLISQMDMRVYEVVVHSRKLLLSSRAARTASMRLAGGSIIFLLLTVIAAALTNSQTMSRAITERVGRLRDGALLIGGGDLGHRIDVTGDDEFAELSNAFNSMTVNLKTSYHSLEKEVEERKRAEEALRKAHDELESRVEERTKELKDAERALREANEGLEQRVADRTAELQAANTLLQDSRRAALNLMEDALAARKEAEKASKKLRQEVAERTKAEEDVMKLSEDMAARNLELEDVNRELEAFIYSVSHDLRAPLRTMSAFVTFLFEEYSEGLDAQGKDYLTRISQSSGRMSRLIEDLLNLSSLSRKEITRKEVDLSSLAGSISSRNHEADPCREVGVSIEDKVTALTDPSLMEIVLSNLIGNAWKFTSKTPGARIEFGRLEKDGKTVYYVRDNGAGFDPQYASKMFQPFHRFHSGDEFDGTGIGLSIVERIIRRLGGRVWAEGEVGKGAAVYFTLG